MHAASSKNQPCEGTESPSVGTLPGGDQTASVACETHSVSFPPRSVGDTPDHSRADLSLPHKVDSRSTLPEQSISVDVNGIGVHAQVPEVRQERSMEVCAEIRLVNTGRMHCEPFKHACMHALYTQGCPI
jgi:hypothetical protein